MRETLNLLKDVDSSSNTIYRDFFGGEGGNKEKKMLGGSKTFYEVGPKKIFFGGKGAQNNIARSQNAAQRKCHRLARCQVVLTKNPFCHGQDPKDWPLPSGTLLACSCSCCSSS